MEPEYWWHGGWWFLWMLPVFMVVVFGIVLVRGSPRWWSHRTREDTHQSATARDILDRRYANGEISRQQYEEMKGVLQQ
jgi:putative membrane protein